jgi:hypothetical protein
LARVVLRGSSVSVQFPSDTGATKDVKRVLDSGPSQALLDDGLNLMIQATRARICGSFDV